MANGDSEQLAQEQFESSCSHPLWQRQDTCSPNKLSLLGHRNNISSFPCNYGWL